MNRFGQLFAIPWWERIRSAGINSSDKVDMVLRIEGNASRRQLVDDAPQTPNVGCGAVAFGGTNFGRHVEGCANVGRCEVVGGDDL